MSRLDQRGGTGAGEQCRGLLDRLTGDPGAVDDYYAARQHLTRIDDQESARTEVRGAVR